MFSFTISSACLAFVGLIFMLVRLVPNRKGTDIYGNPLDSGWLMDALAPYLLGLGLFGLILGMLSTLIGA